MIWMELEKASLPYTAVLLRYRKLQPRDVCLLLLPVNAVKATYLQSLRVFGINFCTSYLCFIKGMTASFGFPHLQCHA